MGRKGVFGWGTLGLIAPTAVLIDLNVFHNTFFTNDFVTLTLWPSSFMMIGSHGFNLATAIGLAVSIAINVLLYVGVGFLASKVVYIARGR